MGERKFLEVFRRYEPREEYRALLMTATHADIRLCRAPGGEDRIERVEADLYFATHQDARALYAMEDELCHLYGAKSFRLFPKYPPDLFRLDYMPEIIAEAERIGAVTHGFFAEPRFCEEEETLYIDLPHRCDSFGNSAEPFFARAQGAHPEIGGCGGACSRPACGI